MGIPEALRAAREAKGLRQSALARTIGMDPGHLSRIESGQSNPNIATLMEIARTLDLEIMLVPRERVPAVRAIVDREKSGWERLADTMSTILEAQQQRPAYRLDEEEGDE
tara:strand:+ start:269 stop:598 length:330 start_codon:yes stop_codon:yes gene_type:complete